MNIRLLGLAILVLMLFALPALAHHSFAMFDQGRVVYMTGKVKQFKNVTKFWSQMGMFGQRLVTLLVTVSHLTQSCIACLYFLHCERDAEPAHKRHVNRAGCRLGPT